MTENSKSPGSNPTFTLTGTINYELKFGDKGIELIWNDKTNPARLVSLLISHEVAGNAQANFKDNYDTIKHDKKLLDRFGWASKTVTGLDIFVGSFIDVVIEENTLPIITNSGEITENSNSQTGENIQEIKLESTTTIQNEVKDV